MERRVCIVVSVVDSLVRFLLELLAYGQSCMVLGIEVLQVDLLVESVLGALVGLLVVHLVHFERVSENIEQARFEGIRSTDAATTPNTPRCLSTRPNMTRVKMCIGDV